MEKLSSYKTELTLLRGYFWALLILWTVLVGSVLLWSLLHQKYETKEVARIHARNSLKKDLVYRWWATGHGGVYVPMTDKTPPNPYLSHIEERDITTPSGRPLTLVNPAYMTRQVHELGAEKYGSHGHITSLKPIRPANAADEWETKALRAFEQGVKEVTSIEKIDGQNYMRLMRPMITEQSCLKCHSEQGYKVGDLRGGLSVSVPMAPLHAIARGHALTLTAGHVVLWLLGVGGISLGRQYLKRRIQERKHVEEQMENLAKFPSENPNPVLRITKDGEVIYSNEAGKSLLAKWKSKVGEIVPGKWNNLIAQALASETGTEEEEEEVKDRIFSISIAPVKEAGYVNLYACDITERKRVEQDRENLLHDMGERVKELTCMYRVSGAIRQHHTLESIFRDVTKFIPPGWLYPEITCARVCFDGSEYSSDSFKETQWKQASNLVVDGKQCGSVEVYYLEEKSTLDEGPFLKEERNLIEGIARALNEVIKRKRAENELEKANDELETRVQKRTKELAMTVEVLQSEVAERMRLQKEVLEISEEEQRRIGRELHDGLQQELVGMTFECQLLNKKLTAKSLPEADDAVRIHRFLSEAIDHTRAITRMLYPIDLDSKDISFALKQLASRVESLFHISCQFTGEKSLVVEGPEIAINIYRIVQEAVTNAIKHGKADSISITLKSSKNGTIFTIRDNGAGLAADYGETEGMGLRIMKYRSSVIGASLDIKSNTKGPGAVVTCSFETKDNKLL